jgi:hypothetical protein
MTLVRYVKKKTVALQTMAMSEKTFLSRAGILSSCVLSPIRRIMLLGCKLGPETWNSTTS